MIKKPAFQCGLLSRPDARASEYTLAIKVVRGGTKYSRRKEHESKKYGEIVFPFYFIQTQVVCREGDSPPTSVTTSLAVETVSENTQRYSVDFDRLALSII